MEMSSEQVAGAARVFDDEVVARLRLASVDGISPRLAARLVTEFGTAAATMAAAGDPWQRVRGVGRSRAALAATASSVDAVMSELVRATAAGAEIVWPRSEDWPPGLDDLSDPPLLLFRRGELQARDLRGVAIVGSRRASAYGRAQARRLAAGLAAAGITVISGLARGVDAAAHLGALSVGGRTVGVLGGGLARFYPPENVSIARDMVDGHGAVLSEFSLDAPPLPYHFPRRNRILAAMSAAVVVVEATEKSGSLITADHALDIGREVLAVPGRVDAPGSRGTHRLLREGAAVCEGVDDILRALGLGLGGEGEHDGNAASNMPPSVNETERAVLTALAGEERYADELIETVDSDADAILSAIASLELRGFVVMGGDGRYGRR
jgi:DNA processing protein